MATAPSDSANRTQGHPVPLSPSHPVTVALLGNPNTGKTTLFNALAGMRQRVGNYPGVTVETKKGQLTHGGRVLHLIDLPGTYSLAPRSPDEMVAVDLVLGHQPGEPRPDVLVSIVDASNLERNLYLTTQALELGVPVVVALNMIDVAQKHGLRIDVDRLARQLGVPVVAVQANKGHGLKALRDAIAATAIACEKERMNIEERRMNDEPVNGSSFVGRSSFPGCLPPCRFPDAFEREVEALREALGGKVQRFLIRRALLDVGGYTEKVLSTQHSVLSTQHSLLSAQHAALSTQPAPATGCKECAAKQSLPALIQAARERLAAAGCPVPAVEAKTRYAWIRQATSGCIERPAKRPVTSTDRLDRVLTHRIWGTLIFLVLMFIVFQAIFTWARPLMKGIGDGKDWLADHLRTLLPAGPLNSLLTDGVLEGVGSIVVFLPQILILFGFIAVLEDCGYMARAAFLMDRLMARCGLSGKSFIPLLSSVACAVPGIMAARVIENRRDRLATILVAPLMSCSARLPVYILLIGAFLTEGFAWWAPGVAMFTMYLLGLVLAPLVALLLKRTLLRGETPVFVMEMPMYKMPSLRTVLRRITDAAAAFLRRAGTFILAAMILVWALLYFPYKDAAGAPYDERIAALEKQLDAGSRDGNEERTTKNEELRSQIDALRGEWTRGSVLGQIGRAIEPAVRPLGWDWRIGMAALASFPAREVVVGTLGIIYNQGKVEADEIRDAEHPSETSLGKALRDAKWDGTDRPVFTAPVALSLMVFFALCCQCASTLAVIRRETNSWRWPAFTFVYMTGLAYVGALVTYQIGSLL
jgi:ferrous iron transport protein B